MRTDSTYTFAWIEHWSDGSGDIHFSRENPLTGHRYETIHYAEEITPTGYARLFNVLIGLQGTLELTQSMEEAGRDALAYYHRPAKCVQCWNLDFLYEQLIDSDWCAVDYEPMSEFAIDYWRYQAQQAVNS